MVACAQAVKSELSYYKRAHGHSREDSCMFFSGYAVLTNYS